MEIQSRPGQEGERHEHMTSQLLHLSQWSSFQSLKDKAVCRHGKSLAPGTISDTVKNYRDLFSPVHENYFRPTLILLANILVLVLIPPCNPECRQRRKLHTPSLKNQHRRSAELGFHISSSYFLLQHDLRCNVQNILPQYVASNHFFISMLNFWDFIVLSLKTLDLQTRNWTVVNLQCSQFIYLAGAVFFYISAFLNCLI
ncbi:hypothetical protein ILYODFUR_029940 [Ilyodon furcidens]|uniref:Uncharacterized protein n=1 Tax=Ilyodon furcidens TaxID=33524 RepID=A0ABV0UYR1_9TELE